MPEEGTNILKYTIYHHKQMRVLFVIYANFKALNQPAYKDISDSTHQIYDQVPCSYCYVIVRSDGIVYKPKLYCVLNAV